ncbi:MAG: UDP-N-acetylglucosamine 1-carboxyvinyltransferase [Caldimicrobium sp.]
MERKYIIRGGRPLKGEIEVKGAKNAALPALACTLLAKGNFLLKNVPKVRDVFCMLKILEYLGAKAQFDGSNLQIDTSGVKRTDIPYELASQIRASILFLGALTAAYGEAVIPRPGGCDIGKRPTDIHEKGLSLLSAELDFKHGNIITRAKRLKGAEIILDFPSVTATENLLMAASLAEGETILKNAAKEPEVVFLAEMLSEMGAEIKGAGTDTIFIKGKKRLQPIKIKIIPDRIEGGTFLILSSLFLENEVIIKNLPIDYLETPCLKLKEMGIEVKKVDRNSYTVKRSKKIWPVEIVTAPYPGFPTDLQPLYAVLLTQAEGTSIIRENLFENRFQYAFELKRLGAKINVEDRVAVITGPTPLSGSPVKATDLRAGAALLLAGLIAENTTTLYRVELIERGYENLPQRIRALGGDIEVVEEENEDSKKF